MAKITLHVKAGDQKPFTRLNKRRCVISTALRREYGVNPATGYSKTVINGQTYQLDGAATAVVDAHDHGQHVGSRTVTLSGPPLLTRAEKAEAAKKARAARKAARAARREKVKSEREKTAEKAKAQAPARP